MPRSIMIDDIDDATASWLIAEAKRQGVSVERVAGQLLQRALEWERRRTALPPYHDLDALAGTWSEDEAGTRAEANRQELQQFLTSERVHQLVIDAETAAQYAIVYRELRGRGRPIPTNDMWIAASALQHGFAVFSDDGHFHEVPGLHVGTRLDDFLL